MFVFPVAQRRSMNSIVVSEDEFPISILILICIAYPFYFVFGINVFFDM
jgi:hypothetical protein